MEILQRTEYDGKGCETSSCLSKQELGRAELYNDRFYGAGQSTVDLSAGIVEGQIAGGVAILWHKKLESVTSVIRTGVDRSKAVHLRLKNKEFVILNVYTPRLFTE